MEVYQGKSVFGGIAIGRISVHKKDEQQVKRVKIENPDLEIARYRQARQTAMEQLQNLYQKALKEVGEANAAIFEIHQMMLEDDDYNESIENIIHMQQVNAEYAVASTGDNFAQMFASMEDDYMRDYTNFERCNGEPCCVFAERICADNYKELLEKGKDSNGEEVFGEMLDDLLYLAELIDFMGITSCLAARRTLSERLTDKLTDSIAGLADEVLEKWESYQDKAE